MLVLAFRRISLVTKYHKISNSVNETRQSSAFDDLYCFEYLFKTHIANMLLLEYTTIYPITECTREVQKYIHAFNKHTKFK